MNPQDALENQLRSWKPRRPSSGLRRALFGPARPRRRSAYWMPWLAPATVAGLLVALQLHPAAGSLGARHAAFLTDRVTLEDCVRTSFEFAHFVVDQNAPPAARVEFALAVSRPVPSAPAAFPRTNDVRR